MQDGRENDNQPSVAGFFQFIGGAISTGVAMLQAVTHTFTEAQLTAAKDRVFANQKTLRKLVDTLDELIQTQIIDKINQEINQESLTVDTMVKVVTSNVETVFNEGVKVHYQTHTEPSAELKKELLSDWISEQLGKNNFDAVHEIIGKKPIRLNDIFSLPSNSERIKTLFGEMVKNKDYTGAYELLEIMPLKSIKTLDKDGVLMAYIYQEKSPKNDKLSTYLSDEILSNLNYSIDLINKTSETFSQKSYELPVLCALITKAEQLQDTQIVELGIQRLQNKLQYLLRFKPEEVENALKEIPYNVVEKLDAYVLVDLYGLDPENSQVTKRLLDIAQTPAPEGATNNKTSAETALPDSLSQLISKAKIRENETISEWGKTGLNNQLTELLKANVAMGNIDAYRLLLDQFEMNHLLNLYVEDPNGEKLSEHLSSNLKRFRLIPEGAFADAPKADLNKEHYFGTRLITAAVLKAKKVGDTTIAQWGQDQLKHEYFDLIANGAPPDAGMQPIREAIVTSFSPEELKGLFQAMNERFPDPDTSDVTQERDALSKLSSTVQTIRGIIPNANPAFIQKLAAINPFGKDGQISKNALTQLRNCMDTDEHALGVLKIVASKGSVQDLENLREIKKASEFTETHKFLMQEINRVPLNTLYAYMYNDELTLAILQRVAKEGTVTDLANLEVKIPQDFSKYTTFLNMGVTDALRDYPALVQRRLNSESPEKKDGLIRESIAKSNPLTQLTFTIQKHQKSVQHLLSGLKDTSFLASELKKLSREDNAKFDSDFVQEYLKKLDLNNVTVLRELLNVGETADQSLTTDIIQLKTMLLNKINAGSAGNNQRSVLNEMKSIIPKLKCDLVLNAMDKAMFSFTSGKTHEALQTDSKFKMMQDIRKNLFQLDPNTNSKKIESLVQEFMLVSNIQRGLISKPDYAITFKEQYGNVKPAEQTGTTPKERIQIAMQKAIIAAMEKPLTHFQILKEKLHNIRREDKIAQMRETLKAFETCLPENEITLAEKFLNDASQQRGIKGSITYAEEFKKTYDAEFKNLGKAPSSRNTLGGS